MPAAAEDGMFSVPPLPYAYDALEPHIDAATMKFHHDFHQPNPPYSIHRRFHHGARVHSSVGSVGAH